MHEATTTTSSVSGSSHVFLEVEEAVGDVHAHISLESVACLAALLLRNRCTLIKKEIRDVFDVASRITT
jgi:hypothetical protein